MWLPAELDAWLEGVADISHAEFGVLRCLSMSDEREIHMSRLAATASVTPSHLSRVVGRLERRGLLLRNADPADARRTLARLTKSGAALIDEIEPGYAAQLREHVFGLLSSREVDQLEQLTEKVLTPLRAECIELLPPRAARK